MKLRALTSALLLAGVSVSVQSAPQQSVFTDVLDIEERYAYSLIEAMLSLVAMNVEHTGKCSGSYNANVQVSQNGSYAAANIDDVDLAADEIEDVNSFTKGTKIVVTGGGELGDVEVTGLEVTSAYDFYGTMAYMNGDVFLDGAKFDEHVIKDFWEVDSLTEGPDTPPGTSDHIVLDYGYELITKLDYPRAKWDQTSYLWRSNGGNGYILIDKHIIAPDPRNNPCHIQYTALVGDFAGGMQTISGKIELEALQSTPQ